MLFAVCIRALCRSGVPPEAWALAGLLPGGHQRARAFAWWHYLWAFTIVRRNILRRLQVSAVAIPVCNGCAGGMH